MPKAGETEERAPWRPAPARPGTPRVAGYTPSRKKNPLSVPAPGRYVDASKSGRRAAIRKRRPEGGPRSRHRTGKVTRHAAGAGDGSRFRQNSPAASTAQHKSANQSPSAA